MADAADYSMDSALVGGILAQPSGLPEFPVASPVERRGAEDTQGKAAFVRLADMLTHSDHGNHSRRTTTGAPARTIGLGPGELRSGHVRPAVPT